MYDFIAKLRNKPEHIRKRIAIGTSVGVTGLVGMIWVTTMATTGAFALAPVNAELPEVSTNDAFALSGTNVKSNFSELLGAVGAATGATTSPSSLTIVDGESSSSFEKRSTNNTSATVIPF